MNLHRCIRIAVAPVAVVALVAGLSGRAFAADSKLATAKSLRCTFQAGAVGGWKKDGAAESAVRTPKLVLLFEAIDADEGTAKQRSGSMLSELSLKVSGGYMHFMQSFRTGPLYTTTVFDKETTAGKFKAVHSRHEYFTIPVPGATSSPEQYYGECEIKS